MKKLLLLPVFCCAALAAETLDRVLAVVGNEAILLSERETLRRDLTNSPALLSIYGISKGDLNDQKLLDFMIEDKVISQAVKEADLGTSDTEVENQIAKIAKQHNIGVKQLEGSLRREGISPDVYRRNIKSQIEKRNLFDREIRRGNGVTEAELRALYRQKIAQEYKMSVLQLPKKSLALANEIKQAVVSGKTKVADAAKSRGASDLGWVNLDTLHPRFAKQLENDRTALILGPVEVDGKLQMLFVEERRQEEEEDFKKRRGALMGEAQAVDFDKRLASWMENKKKELHIVINK